MPLSANDMITQFSDERYLIIRYSGMFGCLSSRDPVTDLARDSELAPVIP